MRVIKVLAPAFVVASALSGCVDGPLSSRGGGAVPLSLAPQFSFAVSSSSLPIEVVKTTPFFASDGSRAGVEHQDGVAPADAAWVVDALVDLNGRDSATINVEVELISLASGRAVVEWSGLVGPIFVDAEGAGEEFNGQVTLIRGPLQNINVQSLGAQGPAALTVGSAGNAWATVTASGPYSVRWSSSNPDVATVEPEGDTVVVRARAAGNAWIRAGAGFHADSVLVRVDALVSGPARLVWLGGTGGAENDWFTASNWSPARVPTAMDTAYFPSGSPPAYLDADAAVGGLIGDSIGGYAVELLENVTLTAHGDVNIPYVYGDSTTRLILAGAPSTLWSWSLPPLVIRGDVNVLGHAYSYGDVLIENGAKLHVGPQDYVFMEGDLTVIGAGLFMTHDTIGGYYSYLDVRDDVTFDGGDGTGRLTGGYLNLAGDFTVTAASCTTFRPTDFVVEIISDTSTISIGCAGAAGNRFWDLWLYSSVQGERVVTLQSDLYVANELYLAWDGQYPTYLVGNGYTVTTHVGSISTSTFDNAYVEVLGQPNGYFYADSLAFTGMTGATRPQLRVNDAGDGCFSCYDWHHIEFDPSASGPYLELNDLVADGDSAILYMAANPGDGPQRTVTTGEAAVYWADVPMRVLEYSGWGQTGPALTALPDSLVAQVVDYAYYGVGGVSVNWSVTLGDGAVSPVTSVSDTAGLAKTQYTMGSSNYPQQHIVASVAGVADSALFYVYEGVPAGARLQQPAASVSPRPTARAAPSDPRERKPRIERPTPARPEPGSKLNSGDRR